VSARVSSALDIAVTFRPWPARKGKMRKAMGDPAEVRFRKRVWAGLTNINAPGKLRPDAAPIRGIA